MLLSLAACGGAAESVADLDDGEHATLADLLAEEDRRPSAAEATALRAGIAADEPLVRRFAVRGLGRLEDPAALAELGPMLDDPDPSVRAQTASAVAQSVFNDASATAAELLRERLGEETDPAVRGALARALGRLRPVDDEVATERLALLIELTRDAPIEALLPTMRGVEWLLRTNSGLRLGRDQVDRLVELTRYGRGGGRSDTIAAGSSDPPLGAAGGVDGAPGTAPDVDTSDAAARVRRLALTALRAGSNAVAADVLEAALYDPDDEVRRLAAAASGDVADAGSVPLLVQIAAADAVGRVRYEGLRVYGRRLRLTEGCAPIVAAVEDPDPHVSLLAIDLLAPGCRGVDATTADDPDVAALLADLARSTPGLPDNDPAVGPRDGINPPLDATVSAAAAPLAWHHGTRALLSLARLDPTAAAPLLPSFALHPVWQVRVYAARAAALTGSIDTLEQLVEDPHPNVADAALRGLAQQLGPGAGGAAVLGLASDDYQLLITATDALEGSDDAAAVDALVGAMARITAQQRETSRDTRLALLERIGELGDGGRVDEVRPYLRDFDPRVAELAAATLTAWGVTVATPAPQALPPQPLPRIDELLALDGAVARVHMANGGTFDLMLHAFEAPTNVARFARQARDGDLDGLTFHRVVPNFVIQGGSPGANEYMGDGPYTRDELGVRSHLRGTVGISTRGRDTGDGQIFINLVDNVRLDHAYTIIGTVIDGMEVVDAILEGAVIERVTLEPRPATE